ncbi:uncharacterized protein LOC130663277 [Microplitis mediator]|uniref:uncharacterized protein LOC130663277 n=1 Tax=Microplitis mediator TaxID=375433 RepID=UPI002553273A|nr:uncharacterized protein LOC130663277 [Microplitis mediator]
MTENDFDPGPHNGPTSSPFGYAQLSPPYSPGSKECTPSVAVPPALQQSSSTYVGDYHRGSNLPHGPFHSDIAVHPTSTLAASASPSTSKQYDFLIHNTHLNEKYVNRSLPNTKNDGAKKVAKRKQTGQNEERKKRLKLTEQRNSLSPINDDVPQDSFCDEDYLDEIEGEGTARPKIIDKNTYQTEPGWLTPRVNKRGVTQIVKCKKCKMPFDTKVKLWTHQKETHFNSKKIIRCPNSYCEFVTDVKHHLSTTCIGTQG